MGPIQADIFSSTARMLHICFTWKNRCAAIWKSKNAWSAMPGVWCLTCIMCMGVIQGKTVMNTLTLGMQSGRIVTSVSASINYSQTLHSRTLLLTWPAILNIWQNIQTDIFVIMSLQDTLDSKKLNQRFLVESLNDKLLYSFQTFVVVSFT